MGFACFFAPFEEDRRRDSMLSSNNIVEFTLEAEAAECWHQPSHPSSSPAQMCTNDVQPVSTRTDDDVWDSDSAGSGPGSPSHHQMDREWEARKQQFYNVSSWSLLQHAPLD
jgi:hypothetical protein